MEKKPKRIRAKTPRTEAMKETQKEYNITHKEKIRQQKIEFYIRNLTPEQFERYWFKKNNPKPAPKNRQQINREYREKAKLKAQDVKLYGEDVHLKNKQIEMQIEQLLIERESKPLDFELQYRINNLNMMLR